jgi:hypothetical protein
MSLLADADRFHELSCRVAAGRAGTDFAVVEDELMGYEDTPLETELAGCVREIARQLEDDPTALTPALLERLLCDMLACQPGVTGYRARLMLYAGDYGDESSPVNYGLVTLARALGAAARRHGEAGEELLAAVPPTLLRSKLTLYYHIGNCEQADVEYTLAEHLMR